MVRKKRILALLLLAALLVGAVPGLQSQALAAGVSADFLSNCSSSYRSGMYYSRLAAVELTGNMASDVVAVAKSQLGYHESSSRKDLTGGWGETGVSYTGNYTEYGRWFFHDDAPYAWCNLFVAWCIRAAGVGESITPYNPFDIDGWHAIGGNIYSWKDYREGKVVPRAGDLILYSSTCSAWKKGSSLIRTSKHIGICTGSDGTYVYTVEGNTSLNGKSGYVASKSRHPDQETGWVYDDTYIYAIIRPNYTGGGYSSSSGSSSSGSSYSSSGSSSSGSSSNGRDANYGTSSLSTMRIEGAEYPTGVLRAGKGYGLRGVIISNYKLNKVVGSILAPDGKPVFQYTSWPDNLYYDIRTGGINDAMTFGKLEPGSYWYVVTAVDSSGMEKDLIWSLFVVEEPSTFTLTLDPDDGNEAYTQTFTYAAKETISPVVPERPGYTFRCWRNEDEGQDYAPGDTIPTDWTNVTLTAQWEEIPNTTGNGRVAFGGR